MNDRHIEKLEVLDGSRAQGNRRRQAVRVTDLESLLLLKDLTSNDVVTLTAADFNALRKDVRALSDALRTVANALQKKII